MKYNKVAITPIVATILLVVVAVILITVVLSFGRDFSNKSLATVDTEKLSKSDASEFVYTKAFSDGVIQFNYAPPANLKDQEIIITGYKIFFDNNETSEISFTSNHTLSQGLNIIPLTDFSDQNVTSRKMDIQLKTSDGKYITLNSITNPDPYVPTVQLEPLSVSIYSPNNNSTIDICNPNYFFTTTNCETYYINTNLDFNATITGGNGEYTCSWDINKYYYFDTFLNQTTENNCSFNMSFPSACTGYYITLTVSSQGVDDVNDSISFYIRDNFDDCDDPSPISH